MIEIKLFCCSIKLVAVQFRLKNPLLFIANGEYGVLVYELGFKIEDSTDVASDLAGFDYSSSYQGYIDLGKNNSAKNYMRI